MWRNIVGVVGGYLVMVAVVFGTFSIAYIALGADRVFEARSFQVTPLWIAVSFVLWLIASVLGGVACAFVTRGWKAPLALAGLVLVLGIAMAVPVALEAKDPAPAVRPAGPGNMEAMEKARVPTWVAFANPFVGVGGALLGTYLRRRRE